MVNSIFAASAKKPRPGAIRKKLDSIQFAEFRKIFPVQLDYIAAFVINMPTISHMAPHGDMDHFLTQIRTGISAAYWFDPVAGEYKPALLSTMTRASGSNQTAWFDELFEGGLKIPKAGTDTPLTIMLTGQPGTGKSTLALEMCYRLAQGPAGQEPLNSVYLTTEGHTPWTIEHARSLRWDANESIFGVGDNAPVCVKSLKTDSHLEEFIQEMERAAAWRVGQPAGNAGASNEPSSIGAIIKAFLAPIVAEIERYGELRDHTPHARHTPQAHHPPQAHHSPQPDVSKDLPPLPRSIIVLDNLNTVPTSSQPGWFPFVKALAKGGSRVFVTILDAHKNDEAKSWEYMADVVIHLGRKYPAGYMIRTLEIRKARYQRHVYGQQQMKIVHAAKPESQKVPSRDHPYREEGGIFIFPSMHLALSRRKMQISVVSGANVPTPYAALDSLLGGGFPLGRCAALAGGRGTHKSRLAFAQVLKSLTEQPNAQATIISLREDESAVLKMLSDIAVHIPDAPAVLENAVKAGRLECSYYPPGFIAAEEFFHRVQLSIARQRATASDGSPVLLVFNSLDLLHSHYPLCAEHSIFVPALVELLCLDSVTSFIVATSGRDRDPYGLMSMADPVFHFKRMTETKEFFYKRVFPKDTAEKAAEHVGSGDSLVQMTVERFAAGVSAGSSVFLLLIDERHPLAEIYRPGLQCFEDRGTELQPGSQTTAVAV